MRRLYAHGQSSGIPGQCRGPLGVELSKRCDTAPAQPPNLSPSPPQFAGFFILGACSMVNTEANLLRSTAAICRDAMKIEAQLRTIGAGKARIQDAEQNAINAGKLLNLAVLRWLRTF